MKISEFRTVAFTVRAHDALGGKVDSNAELGGVRRRVGGEKMSMATADFPDKEGIDWKDWHEPVAKFATAGLHQCEIFRGASRVVHGMRRSLKLVEAPTRLDHDHQDADIRWVYTTYATGLTARHGFKLR